LFDVSVAKLATPATGRHRRRPAQRPPADCADRQRHIAGNPVATLPKASRAVTSTAGVMVAAAAVLVVAR